MPDRLPTPGHIRAIHVALIIFAAGVVGYLWIWSKCHA